VWELWLGADGSELESCAVLTTRPNALVAPLHGRIPWSSPMAWRLPGWRPPAERNWQLSSAWWNSGAQLSG